MKFTVAEAFAIHESMSAVVSNGVSFKGKLGLAFSYNFRVIHDSLAEYITKRDEIVAKYADEVDEETRAKYDEAGFIPPVQITDPEKISKANEEINAYSDLEIEVPAMLVSIDDVSTDDTNDSNTFSVIIWMLKEYAATRDEAQSAKNKDENPTSSEETPVKRRKYSNKK